MHAPASMPASLPVPMMDTFDDVKFMMELELALGRMHPRELQPFDALTPHVREIASRVR